MLYNTLLGLYIVHCIFCERLCLGHMTETLDMKMIAMRFFLLMKFMFLHAAYVMLYLCYFYDFNYQIAQWLLPKFPTTKKTKAS